MPDESHILADWPAPANIRAFTTLRTGPGVSLAPFDRFNLGLRCGDELEHARQNRDRLIREFKLPSPPLWLDQVHGAHVERITTPAIASQTDSEPRVNALPIADASTTDIPDTVLAILTADCLPVLFCNDEGTEVAAAHAGWRGLAAGILESSVRAMHSQPATLMAWLGPAAGPSVYEIGAEVREAFLAHDPAASGAFTATRQDHWLIDLYALARQRLADAGVNRVYGGDLCTISDPQRFFSHRRDQRTGRMASLIFLTTDR